MVPESSATAAAAAAAGGGGSGSSITPAGRECRCEQMDERQHPQSLRPRTGSNLVLIGSLGGQERREICRCNARRIVVDFEDRDHVCEDFREHARQR
jgi:hypothetical protein